jgi:iron complex transport system substrate-binding protein
LKIWKNSSKELKAQVMRWILLIAIFLAAAAAAAVVLAHRKEPASTQGEPNSVVSMTPQLTEILYALGLEDKIIAVSSDSDYPPEALKKPKIGTFWQPNLEAIISIRPKLVIAEDFEQQKQVTRQLERLGYTVLIVSLNNIQQLFETIETVGKATGKESEAQRLAADIKSKLINLSGRLSTGRKFSVLWVIQASPIRAAGRDTFANELIELAGGLNAIGPTVQKYPPVGIEQIVASAPEVIIEPTMGGGDIETQQKAAIEFWSKWPNLPAVKNNRIYVISGDTVSRLGPRLDKGIEAVARCLHPSMFETQR